ncbi:hypothetical protein RJT34_23305 [Clitoria ternatea]|uniref:Uncharacterized protein n=1 Tax=Clitoria ternatea TaxID=43366 RepID=A0AAN9FKW0_CLITE
MELEEAEDEEKDTSTNQYSCVANAKDGGKVRWMCNKGLRLGKQILVAGFVATSAPIVLPPVVVASAIGLAVSMPYAFFLASHACTQCLMSKLLPRPTPQNRKLCFQPNVDIIYTDKEAQEDAMDVIQHNGSREEKALKEDTTRGESNVVQPMSESNGVSIEGVGKIDNKVEEFKTPFEATNVTSVVLEEFQDQAIEGDIEEAELQRETKGLLEKIRDEGRTDRYVEGNIGGVVNESDQDIGPVVEDMEVTHDSRNRFLIEGTKGDLRKEKDPYVGEEMLHLRKGKSRDNLLEGKEVDNTNDSQKSMVETSEQLDGSHFQCETVPDENVGDLPIEMQVYNISIDEESCEVVCEKSDTHIVPEEELKPLPDGTTLQKGKLDNVTSDLLNEETEFYECNETMDPSDADAREIASESALDLFDEKRIDHDAYTIDLQEESSIVDGHTDSMEVVSNEESIWKEIHMIRKIVGYEGTIQASCADELRALYIFTGVEPPTFLNENSCHPQEIKEKLHFLMSIVGIKSNVP